MRKFPAVHPAFVFRSPMDSRLPFEIHSIDSTSFREFTGQKQLSTKDRWIDFVRRRRWLRVMGPRGVRSQVKDDTKQLKESLLQQVGSSLQIGLDAFTAVLP